MDKRAQTIKSMFSDIAGSYDRANSVLSLGIHHLWKQKLVDLSRATMGQSVLDCATGTGDLALRFKQRVGSEGRVVGIDFCQEMLDVAPDKAKQKNYAIEFMQADVTQLPFYEDEFDVTSISFGIRNVENPMKGFTEMARVTKPGGSVMVLEFGQINTPGVREVYNFYSQKVLPFVGGLVSGKREAYQYLNDSSQVFPCGEELKEQILKTGAYSAVSLWPLSFGIAYIYKCTVK